MPIVPSAGRRIQELLPRLESEQAAARESAVAQLTLLGARTLASLPAFIRTASQPGRLAVLDLLERLGERRGLPALLDLVRDLDEDVARRAIEVAAAFPEPKGATALAAVLASSSPALRRAAVLGLSRLHGLGLVEAVDPLLRLLFDAEEDDALRLAALASLSGLDRRTLLPALKRLAGDRSPALVRAATALGSRLTASRSNPRPETTNSADDDEALLARLTARETSATEVQTIVGALAARRSATMIATLRRRLDTVAGDPRADATEVGARARARVHLALAALDSRIALHDLRDMLRARPLVAAQELLATAARVGDGSLVPAIAAVATDEPRVGTAAAAAFQAIARRENLRRTSKAVKAVRPEHRSALESLWPEPAASGGASRSRKRRLR